MPTTKKEEIFFGLMMCLGMVIFMTLYNLYTNDMIGTISIPTLLAQFVLCYCTAFLLEYFIVGPVAKKIVFTLPFDKSKKGIVIVSLALFIVIGMVFFMSIYGLLTSLFYNGFTGESIFQQYFSLVFKNFIFALPLQLIIVGPVVRFLFVRFVKDKGISIPAS
ncbi:hypothetical protein [Paenibacillus sp. Marseille-Q4541]|uniref:hypothetical protein n=1 Tax=Paenibacillus sp. Marseille-Q4541 TaxID=2831522 RepID=UPI001BA8D61C|nr:hypothetical protein [Paenibacillus sp. Marseille-Q4541]